MIYLFINEGKEDACMIPMSSVDSMALAIEVEQGAKISLIQTKIKGQLKLFETDTLSVITTEDSERYVAQKIYEQFAPKKV